MVNLYYSNVNKTYSISEKLYLNLKQIILIDEHKKICHKLGTFIE